MIKNTLNSPSRLASATAIIALLLSLCYYPGTLSAEDISGVHDLLNRMERAYASREIPKYKDLLSDNCVIIRTPTDESPENKVMDKPTAIHSLEIAFKKEDSPISLQFTNREIEVQESVAVLKLGLRYKWMGGRNLTEEAMAISVKEQGDWRLLFLMPRFFRSVCIITMVSPSRQAGRLGLKAGDLILSYNKQKIETSSQFIKTTHGTAGLPSDNKIPLVVRRGDQELRFEAEPGILGVNVETRLLPEGEVAIIHSGEEHPLKSVMRRITDAIRNQDAGAWLGLCSQNAALFIYPTEQRGAVITIGRKEAPSRLPQIWERVSRSVKMDTYQYVEGRALVKDNLALAVCHWKFQKQNGQEQHIRQLQLYTLESDLWRFVANLSLAGGIDIGLPSSGTSSSDTSLQIKAKQLPMQVGNRWIFEVKSSNETINGKKYYYSFFDSFEHDGQTYYRRRAEIPGIFEKTEGLQVLKPDGWYTYWDVDDKNPHDLIKLPLTAGMSWEKDILVKDDRGKHLRWNKWVAEAEETITVPAGTFKCIRLRYFNYTLEKNNDELLWLAPDIGLVKIEDVDGPAFNLLKLERKIEPISIDKNTRSKTGKQGALPGMEKPDEKKFDLPSDQKRRKEIRDKLEKWGKISPGSSSIIDHRVEIPRMVLAFYYPWYGNPKVPTGSGILSHWSGIDEKNKEIENSTHYPRLGAYDSHDPNTIVRHCRWARKAGIDGFILSWWGRETFSGQAIDCLLKPCAELGIHLSIYYEAVRNPRKPDTAVQDLLYVLKKYGNHPAWLKLDGKPVIFIYGRAMNELDLDGWVEAAGRLRREHQPGVVLIADQLSQKAARVFDGIHTYITAGHLKDKNLEQARNWAKKAYPAWIKTAEELGRISTVTVIPGYDDTKEREPGMVIPRRDGELYRIQWEEALNANPDWILITSFNEWHEGTEIEPSEQFGEKYIDMTSDFSGRFKSRSPKSTWQKSALESLFPIDRSKEVESIMVSNFDNYENPLKPVVFPQSSWTAGKGKPEAHSKCDVVCDTGAAGTHCSLRWKYHTKGTWVNVGLVLTGSWDDSVDLSNYHSLSFYIKGLGARGCRLKFQTSPMVDKDLTSATLTLDVSPQWKRMEIDLEENPSLENLHLEETFALSFVDSDEKYASNVIWIDEVRLHKRLK